jgi:dipeptidyl aminopeptidase/acylaminoacyl peptidase
MKILGLKTVLVGAVLGAVWAGLGGVGVANGQVSGQEPMSQNRDMGHPSAKRPMTFADLMAMKRVSDPQISPSGRWVMFSVTDVSLEKNTKVNHLWVVPLAGGKEEQLTFGSGESFGRFSPDGQFISFTGAPTKDDPVSRIVIATWDEKNPKAGVQRQLNAVSGDADGAIWSPDSQRLLFTTQVYPGCSDKPTWAEEDACDKAKDEEAEKSPVKAQVWDELLYRHWDQYTGLKRTHIVVVKILLSGAQLRDLTPRSAVGDAETPTWFLGAPLQYAWAPDSKEIAYVTNLDPVPAASTNNDVFTLRLDEPGAKAVKVSTSPGSDDAPAYSPDGKYLAFRSQARGGFESEKFGLVVMDRSSGSIRTLTTDFDSWVDEFAWAPDSNDLYIASPIEGKELVFEFAATGGKIKEVASTHIGEFTFECSMDFIGCEQAEFGGIQVTPDGKRLLTTRMSVNRPAEIVAMTKVEVDPVAWYRGACAGCWGIVQRDDGRKPWNVATDIGPVLVDLKPLTRLNDSLLRTLDLPLMEHFWFIGAANTKVEGFILRPPGFDAGKKYPVKFVMHGGPQTALGDSWSYRWNWELLAADGYVVVGINRRGSTGYGQKFVDEVSGDWGGRAYEDLMKGLDYAEAHYPFIDKTRECALGASYGGFMADWVLTHTNRFQCVVTHDGMYDPVSAYGSTEELWFNEWEFRRPEDFPKGWDGFTTKTNTEILTGGQNDGQNAGILRSAQNDKQKSEVSQGSGHPAEPWRYQKLPAEQDPFRKWSPMRYIENARTPTLVIHSQKDYRLDVSQGFELYTALQRRGVASKFLYFPDEGHWVLKPQNSQLWYETVDDWCDRWTKTGKYAEK